VAASAGSAYGTGICRYRRRVMEQVSATGVAGLMRRNTSGKRLGIPILSVWHDATERDEHVHSSVI